MLREHTALRHAQQAEIDTDALRWPRRNRP